MRKYITIGLLVLLMGCGFTLPVVTPPPLPTPTPTPVPEPTPTPTPKPVDVGKPFPQGIPDSEFTGIPATKENADDVNDVMRLITGCNVGSRCLHGSDPQEWMRLVVVALRERGLDCPIHRGQDVDHPKHAALDAGQHRDGGTDEIAVRVPRSGICRWEGYHITTHGPKPTVVWAPGSIRPSWSIPRDYCKFGIAPQPTPVPVPPPVSVDGCSPPLPPMAKLKMVVHCNSRGKCDLTPKVVKACDYCESIGMGEIGGTLRCGCPVRNEGSIERSACEQFVLGGGDPRWFCNGAEIDSLDNPFQAKCLGEATACNVDLSVCSA